MSFESEYLTNLIMSMRFQAEYEHNVDPDQMTYEELLELEEKIGSVSRGISSGQKSQLEKLKREVRRKKTEKSQSEEEM